jgi:inosine-uridine nucleoside N-ribohydrolase
MSSPLTQRVPALNGLRRMCAVTVLALLGIGVAARSSSETAPIPVVFDTDIGGDVDDGWALSFLLASPEVDVKLIVSDSHDTVNKARLVSELLLAAGRTDIPIGVGLQGASPTDPKAKWIQSYPGTVRRNGVQALIGAIMHSKRRITLLATGPVPNLEVALQREPRIVDHAKLVVMGGSIGNQEQGGSGLPEYNVRRDPKAAQVAYGASWDVTMAPTDAAGQVRLNEQEYALVRNSRNPVARLLMKQYAAWDTHTKDARGPRTKSYILWDTAAVYLTFDQTYCRMRNIRLQVTDKGVTKPVPDGKLTHVAMGWKNLDAFRQMLVERIAHYKPRKSPAW